jgi:hypothetical protein
MAPRRSQRPPAPSRRLIGSPAASQSQATAAAGLLALNAGIRRSGTRSPRPRPRVIRRGSSTTASISVGDGEPGGGAEDEEIEEDSESDLRGSQEESNTQYRRQRGLQRDKSNVPDSQPPSGQPAPDSAFDSDLDDDIPLSDLKHFNFQVISTLKNKAAGGDLVNTKHWSYSAYLALECAQLQARIHHQPGHTIIPPRFASEMRIQAKGLTPALRIPIRQDSDLENILRAMHKVRTQQGKKDASATLTIPFEYVIDIEPTPPISTPNASHPARRTATNRQREQAAANAAVAAIVGDFRTQIAAAHACPDALCKNNPKPCVVTAQYGHLRIGTRIMRDWCTEVRDGKATVQKCPPTLVARMIKEAGRRVGHRELAAKVETNSPGVNLYFGAGTESGQLRHHQPLASSPPGSVSGNDDKNTELYIDWLIAEGHGKKEQLESAKSVLEDNGWGYSDLRKIKDDQWVRMGIPGGIQTKLLKHWKTWGRLPKHSDDSIHHSEGSISVFNDEL